MTGSLSRALPFLWLCLCPLIVGIARGDGIFVLRPNELLLLLMGFAAGALLLRDFIDNRLVLPEWRKTDGAVMTLVVFGTLVPLLLGYGRGTQFVSDDILYAIVFVKYAMLYGLFRLFGPESRDLRKLLWAMLATQAVVGIIALMQAKDLLGMNAFLAAYYDDPFEGASIANSLRASSTIASSFGLADSMTMSLALVLAMLASGMRLHFWERNALFCLALVFAGATLAAGSFTGIIGCAVAALVVGALTGRLQQIVGYSLPLAACGAAALWPTIAARLEGFSSYRSLPKSWLGRLENLETFFWPEVFSGWNWLLGVRPAARVAAPETWRDWVYIESGHTWLLWIGGLPMLLAFAYFLWSILCDLYLNRPKSSLKSDPLSVAALAATAMIAVIMLFDPHLTVRGCADLFFPLLAMALCARQAQAENERAELMSVGLSFTAKPRRPQHAWLPGIASWDRWMVGGTGIEPVTPTMSR